MPLLFLYIFLLYLRLPKRSKSLLRLIDYCLLMLSFDFLYSLHHNLRLGSNMVHYMLLPRFLQWLGLLFLFVLLLQYLPNCSLCYTGLSRCQHYFRSDRCMALSLLHRQHYWLLPNIVHILVYMYMMLRQIHLLIHIHLIGATHRLRILRSFEFLVIWFHCIYFLVLRLLTKVLFLGILRSRIEFHWNRIILLLLLLIRFYIPILFLNKLMASILRHSNIFFLFCLRLHLD